ncbi:MAG: 50S ribosomal protein L10 [Desulfotomaculum sp.]|nr:50S ribosomal protein L10 [Desulfotomaculum sp.]
MQSKQQKEQIVAAVKEKIQNSQVTILAGYRGITVEQITNLRAELRQADCEIKVIKNTLTKIAMANLGIKGLDAYLSGPTILTFSQSNIVEAAKILSKFSEEVNEGLSIKGGLLEGKVVDDKAITALAKLPPREVLLAKVLGGMQTPLYSFAGVLAANLRNFVYVLEAVRKQKELEQVAS